MNNGNKQVHMYLLLDYIPRNNIYLRDLPRNHLEKIKTVKFEFSDYKVSLYIILRSTTNSHVFHMKECWFNAQIITE